MPIPYERSPVRYADLRWRGRELGELVERLTRGKVRRTDWAHLDPDLRFDRHPLHDHRHSGGIVEVDVGRGRIQHVARALDHEHHHVHLVGDLAHGAVHLAVERVGVLRLVAGRVDELVLRILVGAAEAPSFPANARIVAASNRDLKKESELGNFRLDLFFRLSIIQVDIPPLRDRGDDVLQLSQERP